MQPTCSGSGWLQQEMRSEGRRLGSPWSFIQWVHKTHWMEDKLRSWQPSGIWRHVLLMNWTDVSEMRRPASIIVLMVDKPLKRRYTSTILHGALMMEAVSISETTVYFKEITRRCITEGCYLHARRREDLKSYQHLEGHLASLVYLRPCAVKQIIKCKLGLCSVASGNICWSRFASLRCFVCVE
jgi:hypothetical protein